MNGPKFSMLTGLHVGLVALAIAGLTSSIIVWPQPFLFNKTIQLPAFAAGFPWPTKFAQAWILLFLVGPALAAASFRRAAWSLAAILVLSPALAVTWRPIDVHPLVNGLFNVAWVACFHGTVPFAIGLLIAAAVARLRRSTAERPEPHTADRTQGASGAKWR